MRNADALTDLFRIAGGRHGVTTTAEAARLGVSRAQIRTGIRRGIWRSPAPGILVAVAAAGGWAQDCAIAVLIADGLASHRAGGRLHRLDGFDEAPVELTVDRDRRARTAAAIVHRTGVMDPRDRTTVDGIPVTSLARTLVDLGAVVDDDRVEQALDDALRRGVSMRWIAETLERVDRPGPSGCASLRRVLARPDRTGPIPDSKFERMVERAVVDGGLPQPDRQIEVRDVDGRVIGRIDAGWPELQLGLEAHSARWHDGARRERADGRRDRRLLAAGWELVYVTWWDIEHPDEFLAELTQAYRVRERRLAG